MVWYNELKENKDDPFGLLNEENPALNGKNFDISIEGIHISYELERILKSRQENDGRPVQNKALNCCRHCSGPLRSGNHSTELVCDDCGYVVDCDVSMTEMPTCTVESGKIRLVGANSVFLRANMHRTTRSNATEVRKRYILEDYKRFRRAFQADHGKNIPLTVCETATELYNAVQENCVKRSQNKKLIMAACLWRSCLAENFAPSFAEIATFMKLPHKGFAKGENFLRFLVSDEKMDLDMEFDPTMPTIVTFFEKLMLRGDRYMNLHLAAYEIIKIADENNIGVSSMLRSKVAGSVYSVLSRCSDSSLVAQSVDINQYSKLVEVGLTTIKRFLMDIHDYHSYFEGCYKKFGLVYTQKIQQKKNDYSNKVKR